MTVRQPSYTEMKIPECNPTFCLCSYFFTLLTFVPALHLDSGGAGGRGAIVLTVLRILDVYPDPGFLIFFIPDPAPNDKKESGKI
jgi:hypothetical protein